MRGDDTVNDQVREKAQGDERTIFGTDGVRGLANACLLYTSPSPRDLSTSRMPSSA